MGTRLWSWVSLAAIAGLVSCSAEPTKPHTYSVTGHVKLTGYLVDAGGVFSGTKVVGDADGVPVELVYGSRVVAQATTAGGAYRFTGVQPGGYVVRSNPVPPIADHTEDVTVATTDVAVADTVRLVSVGDLWPTPNPIGSGTRIYFEIPDSQYVQVMVRNMGGQPLKTLFVGVLSGGVHSASWDGLDVNGSPAPGKIFWVTLESGADQRAHLVFK